MSDPRRALKSHQGGRARPSDEIRRGVLEGDATVRRDRHALDDVALAGLGQALL
jgi:hypothetical protein